MIQVIKHFSDGIKQLEVRNVEVPANIVELINLMPKLEKIFLSSVKHTDEFNTGNNTRLQLPKLNEFKSVLCSEIVLNIFGTLPSNTLRKIMVSTHYTHVDATITLFGGQNNIEDAEIDACIAKMINFQQMKLKSLKFHDQYSGNLEKIVQGQNELKRFEVHSIKRGDLGIICNELNSLEDLFVWEVNFESIYELADLSRLNKLKKLQLSFDGIDSSDLNQSLSSVVSDTLLDMRLLCYNVVLSPSTLKQLGRNMPQLKHLQIVSSSSLHTLDSIVRYFPNLVDLRLSRVVESPEDRFMLQDGITHNNLKKISLAVETSSSKELSKLFLCFTKLESLVITTNTSVTTDFVESLRENCRNLNYFHYGMFRYHVEARLDDFIDCETILRKFDGLYATINFHSNSWHMER